MHIEILCEDLSGEKLLENLVPRIIGEQGDPHTWRIHSYRGIGRIPKNLSKKPNPTSRVLLNQLPKILQGYGKTPGIDAVIIVADTDTKDCKEFLKELNSILESCAPRPNTMFRLAIEEMEAWLLGDRNALLSAYPKAKADILDKYVPDSVCGTWETLADAVHNGGTASIKRAGWPLPGQLKSQWAENISPFMSLDNNTSPSFNKFVQGLTRIIS